MPTLSGKGKCGPLKTSKKQKIIHILKTTQSHTHQAKTRNENNFLKSKTKKNQKPNSVPQYGRQFFGRTNRSCEQGRSP